LFTPHLRNAWVELTVYCQEVSATTGLSDNRGKLSWSV
jgi:hypothetical protein